MTKIIEQALARVPERARNNISRHLIPLTTTIFDALQALNGLSGGSLNLFATDENGRIAGTLTDGDIRRGMIAGALPGDSISKVLHTDFLAIMDDDEPFAAFENARKRGIRLLPELREGFIVALHDLSSEKALLPLDAVLMAGGKGERLRPLTLTSPKPLLPVGGKAIIDYNVEELEANGVNSIFVTVNYLKEQIIDHFAGRDSRAEVSCIAEPQRLGTIGSLSLVAPLLTHRNILVMNSDLLTTIDFEAFYRHHIESGADLTIAGVPYTVSVPYAILDTEGERVRALREKPTFNYLANGGVYIMKRALVDRIPAATFTDAPDFIEELIRDGLKVGFFPIEGIWIDIGNPNDYDYADRMMSKR